MNNSKSAYCRLCAKPKPNEELIDMCATAQKMFEIYVKLKIINGRVDFQNKTLPKTVCLVCITALDRAFEFVCGIDIAQSTLQDLFTLQVNKEDYHNDCSLDEPLVTEVAKVEEEVDFKLELEFNDFDTDDKAVTLENMRGKASKKKKNKEKPLLQTDLDNKPLEQVKLTWETYIWVCSYCGTQFRTDEELKTHSMKYHKSCNAYRCTDCNIRKFCVDRFVAHVRRHRKNLKLSCYKCFQRFPNCRRVNEHKNTHLTTSHVCRGCNTSFESQDDLNQHTADYFKDRRCRKIPIYNIGEDGLSCLLCKKTFKNKAGLNTHLLTHTERTRDYICDKCGKCFLKKEKLTTHMVNHMDIRPYQCEICRRSFKTAYQLRCHVGVHDGIKPFSCDQCGRCFRLRKQLQSHKIIHTDLLPHVCSYCNKQFRFKTILNDHVRLHTGVKPYSCHICQRDFTNWPNYNKHMKGRHDMNMAKKKHTPDGVFPIDPATGDVVVIPETKKTLEWKKEVMVQRRPGRPKMVKTNEKK